MTPEEARKYIRKIMGPEHRELEGEEHDHTWLMLQFLDPIRSSNNQRTSTDEYRVGDKNYHVHYGLHADGRPMIEEVEDDDE